MFGIVSDVWLAFGAGIFLGFAFGVTLMALFAINREGL